MLNIFNTQPSISRQFIILITGVITLALLTNAVFQYQNEKEIAYEKLVERGNSIGKLLSRIAIDALLTYDNQMLNELSLSASEQTGVIYTIFIDNEKNTLTNYLNNKNIHIKNAQDKASTDTLFNIYSELQKNNNILHLSFPVIFNNQKLADLKIGFDTKEMLSEPIRNLTLHLLSSLIFGIIIGVGIYIGFRRKISRPIIKLINSAHLISTFDFTHNISIKGKNELSELANALDFMRLTLKDAVESKDKTLKEAAELNNSLEIRVKDRTQTLEELNSQITHQATHDPLTGLANRVLIVERLRSAIDYAHRNHTRLAVFILDLNNFKEINDTLGHPEGDLILVEVAKRIPHALRTSDSVGRLGGDEFAVVLPDIDEKNAVDVGNKIVSALQPVFELSSQTVTIGVSIGIALYPAHGEDQSSLIRHADVAMYYSKRQGHHVTVYNPEFDTHTPWRLVLMADLKDAIEQNLLELHYQPQISINNNQAYGVEALLRWNHPVQGYIPPDQFIYIAENSGLIKDLTEWVLNTALIQWKAWEKDGLALTISVNISAKNVVDPSLPELLYNLTKKHNVPHEYIILELTESTIMSNPDQALKLMLNKKLSGIRYSIDDFGTGYSSLSYLKKLPVHEVKIDKSFVRDMDTNEDDASIVHSVIQLSHNLGHIVVAEGVEDVGTLEALSLLGCDSAQGYYISRPIHASDIPEFLNREIIKNDATAT